MFKNLTFDNISLKDYGVYISGDAVYDSPERDVEMISIPGRNGAFALDRGRFNNITVAYPAGVYSSAQTDFAEEVSTLRNLLASKKGYCRIQDEYNPDEYRLGVYVKGLEFDPVHYNEASQFDIEFNCKPQRFLTSGEEVFTLGEWGETETKSGSIVSFEGDETTAVKSLTAQIVPKQAGSGYPSPTNIRSISGTDTVNVTRCGKNILKPNINSGLIGINVGNDDTTVTASTRYGYTDPIDGSQPLTLSYRSTDLNKLDSMWALRYRNGIVIEKLLSATLTTNFAYKTFAGVEGTYIRLEYGSKSGYAVGDTPSGELQLEKGSTATAYEPYQGNTYPITLPQTVYGGTLDVTSGELVIDKIGLTFNGSEDWWTNANVDYFGLSNVPNSYDNNDRTQIANWLVGGGSGYTTFGSYRTQTNGVVAVGNNESGSKHWDSVATFKTYLQSHNLTIVYKVQTPTEIQLTPTEVNTLLGQNNIWADSGDVTIEIGQNPYILVNPTLFDAHPLLQFNSNGNDGTINFGSQQIKVLNAILGRVGLGLDVTGSRTSSLIWQDVVTVQNLGSFNAGDTIFFNGGKVIFTFDYRPISVEVISHSSDLNVYWQRGSNNLEFSLNNMEFHVGTGTTYSFTSSIKVKASNSPLLEETKTFTVTTSCSREGVLTVTWTGGDYSFGSYINIQSASNYTGYGYSTKNSLEDVDIYVDLDIGEAYSIDSDDNVVSLNNFVNLGGELPTLEPGATEITTDSSISNVKVTPRWWKV